MYKNKYLKYKQKYLSLRGGAMISDTQSPIETLQALKIKYTTNPSMPLCTFMSSLCHDNIMYLNSNKKLIQKIIDRINEDNNGIILTSTGDNKLSDDIYTIIDDDTNELIDSINNYNIKTACKNVVEENLQIKDKKFKLIKNRIKFNYIINSFLKKEYNFLDIPENKESSEYIAIYTEYNKLMYNLNTPKKETTLGFSEKFTTYNKRHKANLIIELLIQELYK
jgi:hypothetical protein